MRSSQADTAAVTVIHSFSDSFYQSQHPVVVVILISAAILLPSSLTASIHWRCINYREGLQLTACFMCALNRERCRSM